MSNTEPKLLENEYDYVITDHRKYYCQAYAPIKI
jgi:hypothetical protein